MENNFNISQLTSSCCHYRVYPYHSFEYDGKKSITKVYKGYRCIKCGQKCNAKSKETINSK